MSLSQLWECPGCGKRELERGLSLYDLARRASAPKPVLKFGCGCPGYPWLRMVGGPEEAFDPPSAMDGEPDADEAHKIRQERDRHDDPELDRAFAAEAEGAYARMHGRKVERNCLRCEGAGGRLDRNGIWCACRDCLGCGKVMR